MKRLGAFRGPIPIIVMSWGLSALLVVVLGYAYFTSSEEPLEFTNPQVVTSAVPISLRAGSTITVAGEKCNTADHAVSVLATFQWRRLDIRPHIVVVSRDLISTYAPGDGCGAPGVFVNTVPAGVVPGIWQIEGVEVVTSGGKQTATWVTEAFEISP